MAESCITACPRCKGPDIRPRPGADAETNWRCSDCLYKFDEPIERQPIQVNDGLARKLEDADPDEILPDGGHPIARPDQPALESYSFRLPDELIAQVDTLLDVGLYASRSEAIRSAIRREIRLQAGERDAVAETLQRTYDVAMDGRRPETIGSLERLADQLGVDLEREVER